MSPFQEVLLFLIGTLFDIYISFLLIRLLLGFARADFRNPISQFLVKVTNPVLIPLRRFIPAIGKLDTSAVVAALALKAAQAFLMAIILGGMLTGDGAFKMIVGDLLKTVIWIYIIALVVQAVMSWIGNAQGNPIAPLLQSLTEPLIRPMRKFIPSIGMVDISPLVVILLLQVALILVRPLTCDNILVCMAKSSPMF